MDGLECVGSNREGRGEEVKIAKACGGRGTRKYCWAVGRWCANLASREWRVLLAAAWPPIFELSRVVIVGLSHGT